MKCVACGGEQMVEGELTDPTSGGYGVVFKPDDTPRLKRWFGLGMLPVRAHGCAHCGHLQLSVRFSDEDLERRQLFEGEQPGVLERLEGDAD
jgi:hypothetical protein